MRLVPRRENKRRSRSVEEDLQGPLTASTLFPRSLQRGPDLLCLLFGASTLLSKLNYAVTSSALTLARQSRRLYLVKHCSNTHEVSAGPGFGYVAYHRDYLW